MARVCRTIEMISGLPSCSSTELRSVSFNIRFPRVPGEIKFESGFGNCSLRPPKLAAVRPPSPRARKLPRRTQWIQPSLHRYLSFCMAWKGGIGSSNWSTALEHGQWLGERGTERRTDIKRGSKDHVLPARILKYINGLCCRQEPEQPVVFHGSRLKGSPKGVCGKNVRLSVLSLNPASTSLRSFDVESGFLNLPHIVAFRSCTRTSTRTDTEPITLRPPKRLSPLVV
ncbi:hypothetical protein P170DRAFT_246348 [Aspergillus steynii IBT 23096]|uniref:Uncharacterized protein n=1 Tax=Aspergillus steynii IBT 23096 TaxID=1392250 RepID=A0A2I2FY34_9EURO|nr:uncharacterized protein P170DRAFT_246348 [Aspergillus steynii IBT 23096]PLB45545.1 hypothetical protein P170DRAFT_246348 [Aspergillus steynii IBT 23096]